MEGDGQVWMSVLGSELPLNDVMMFKNLLRHYKKGFVGSLHYEQHEK